MAKNSGHIKFSVVIPVYNGTKTIERAINSVLAQSHKASEIIVVDDASSDDTCALLREKYAGSIRLIEKKSNEGSGAARNNGMDAATGDYLAFLDADDSWHRDKLKIMAAALEAQPGIALLFHKYTLEGIAGLEMPQDVQPVPVSFVRLLPRNVISTSCAVISSKLGLRFEPTMRFTEDYDLWLRVAWRHPVYFIDLNLTQLYRGITTKGGISSNKWLMRRGELRAYSRLANLNPLLLPLVPFLWTYSLMKHVFKSHKS